MEPKEGVIGNNHKNQKGKGNNANANEGKGGGVLRSRGEQAWMEGGGILKRNMVNSKTKEIKKKYQ